MTTVPAELLKGWHPLDGVPLPETAPDRWDGPHVGVRLVEGLRALRRVPMNGHPREFGNSWPEIVREYAERSQYEDDPQWKADQAALGNRIKLRPSSIEIERMEQAIVWPARYLGGMPQLLKVVGVVALARSYHRDIDHAARRRLRLPVRLVRRWNREGLDTIACGLIRDRVRVS